MASLSYTIVLFLCFHACSARPLMVSTKDVITNQHHTNVANQEFFEGKKVMPFSHQAAGAEVQTWKRGDRSTLEKSSNSAENVEVMDYAQPHRKPPIHNKGT